MSKVIQLTKGSFEQGVLKSELPVLVDFWAPWCQPCLMMAPILDELSEEMSDELRIAKVNIEEPINKEIAINYQMRSIPNMKLFYKGDVVGEFIGTRPKEVFREEIKRILENLQSTQSFKEERNGQ